jgi:hypothetical protein
MSDVTEMTLKEPAWGWQGQAKHQTEPNKVSYIGGAQQTYLPGLAADKDGMRSDHAYISRYEAAERTPHEKQQQGRNGQISSASVRPYAVIAE